MANGDNNKSAGARRQDPSDPNKAAQDTTSQAAQDSADVKSAQATAIAEQTEQDKALRSRDPLRNGDKGYVGTSSDVDEKEVSDENDRIAKLKSESSDLAAKIVTADEAKRKADMEYEVLQSQARLKNAELLKLVGTPASRPTTIVEYSAQAKRDGSKMVSCVVPKTFTMLLDDHRPLEVLAGVRSMPASLADHWWMRANGVMSASS